MTEESSDSNCPTQETDGNLSFLLEYNFDNADFEALFDQVNLQACEQYNTYGGDSLLQQPGPSFGNVGELSMTSDVLSVEGGTLEKPKALFEVYAQNLDESQFHESSGGSNLLSIPVRLIESTDASQPVESTVSHIPSSLPPSQNWSGRYDFEVSFTPQERNTKGISWTYSRINDKLYVGKDAPCPINFSTNSIMPDNVKIRATALYSSPESASEVVARCVNHSLEEKSKNIFEAEHLVRCESSVATYEVDASTKRHSVVVPFENPPAGQQFSTYIYKFTCFGSCPFGPNRRPLMLVFSLERGNEVLGRRKVDVKICACPGRDRKADEQSATLESGTSKKRKESETISLSKVLDFTESINLPPTKKVKATPGQDGLYRLIVDDPECYEFLTQMKKLFEMCKTMNNMSPEAKKVLAHYNQRKGYGF